MKFERFEDILVWQKSKDVVSKIYSEFNNIPDRSFEHQIKRASVSIMNNIAEGYERKTNNEFKHFLYISKGSAGEVRSMLYLALDLNFISKQNFDDLFNNLIEISKMLSGLIKTL